MNNTEIIEKILDLKQKRNAVILAHNYQAPEVQDIADYTGDSLELSRIAAKTDCETIVFCGVTFMAETANILSPQKTVLLPDPHAGCPLADMVDLAHFKELKAQHPEAVTVCYVNSSAEVKAESDVCCTSANAVKVVQSLNGAPEILFVPCRHLGDYVARETGKPIVLARGYCPTHHKIFPEDITKLKEQYPDAEVLAHPECTRAVLELSDHVCSTSQMIRVIAASSANRFIVCTEMGLLHRLKKDNPDKEFFLPGACVCPNMKKITLEKVLWSLQKMQHRVVVPEEIRVRALNSIEKMLLYA
jgi:quinolinate synthase